MSRDLGKTPGTPVPPPALRATRPGWRDPRLWLGVLLLAGSVVLGARLLAAADDTVRVWATTAEQGSGASLEPAALQVQRVRFADGAALERYFRADEPVPEGLVLRRDVGAGELLARSAVRPAGDEPVLEVPLAVDPQRVPPDVRSGSVVDVWVAGADAPALSGVTVVAAPSYDDTFAVSGTRQVVVAVHDERAAAFERELGRLDDPVIRILRRS